MTVGLGIGLCLEFELRLGIRVSRYDENDVNCPESCPR